MEQPSPPQERPSASASRERIAAAGKSWHKVLGIAASASIDDVKKAYRQLALLHHPDKPEGDSDTFKRVQESYVIGLRKCRKTPPTKLRAQPKPKAVPKTKASPKKRPKEGVQAKRAADSAASPKKQRKAGVKAKRATDSTAGAKEETNAPKKTKRRCWTLPPDASKAKVCKAVEQWVACGGSGETMMPDEIRTVTPEVLASWIREASCIPVDVRELEGSPGQAMQGAQPLSYCQLLSAPDEVVPLVARLKEAGRRVALFSDSGGRMGRCGLVGAIIVDLFGIDEKVVWRLEGGFMAWDQWLDSHRDVARLVEPLAMRLERRRAAGAIRQRLEEAERKEPDPSPSEGACAGA